MFDDPHALIAPDYDSDEPRLRVIGFSSQLRLLFVVAIEVVGDDDEIRIISARRATGAERGAMRNSSSKKRIPLAAAQKKALRDEPEPTAEELEDIPEIDLSRGPVFRGPGALQRALEHMRAHRRGRPRKDGPGKDDPAAKTRVKSIRLPEAAWKEIERRAKAQRTTDAAVIRDALADWLERTGS